MADPVGIALEERIVLKDEESHQPRRAGFASHPRESDGGSNSSRYMTSRGSFSQLLRPPAASSASECMVPWFPSECECISPCPFCILGVHHEAGDAEVNAALHEREQEEPLPKNNEFKNMICRLARDYIFASPRRQQISRRRKTKMGVWGELTDSDDDVHGAPASMPHKRPSKARGSADTSCLTIAWKWKKKWRPRE